MTTTLNPARSEHAKLEAQAQPRATLRFDWLASLVSTVLISGLYLDGWAHAHGKVDQSFFTPYHAVLYSGFGLVALFFGSAFVGNLLRGYRPVRALPVGYGLSLLGVITFMLGGPADLIWHTLFGIEESVDALLSPSHLLLALGGILMITGPFRSLWHRSERQDGGWRTLGPAIVSMSLILSVLAFFTQYAHPFVNPSPFRATAQRDAIVGIVGIFLQTGIMTGLLLLATRRWRLPMGSIAFMLTGNMLMVSVLRDGYRFIPVALIAGLIADLLVYLLRPSVARPLALHVWAFLIPITLWSCYFAALFMGGHVAWSIHLWTGVIVLAGVVGLFLSYLVVPPTVLPERA